MPLMPHITIITYKATVYLATYENQLIEEYMYIIQECTVKMLYMSSFTLHVAR